MRYTTVFIDLDDTLIDTSGTLSLALRKIYDTHNLKDEYPDYNYFQQTYFENNFKIWDDYSKGIISKEELSEKRFGGLFTDRNKFKEETIKMINEDYLETAILKTKAIDGAKKIIDHLHNRYKLAIISNGFTEMQYRKMELCGFDISKFEVVILSDEVNFTKPDIRIFNYAMKRTTSSANECIMIGDNLLSDISGAKNAGIHQIWFNPSRFIQDEIEPTHTVNSLDEIITIL